VADQDLADVPVVLEAIEEPRLADLLGRFLADEEVATAGHHLEQALVLVGAHLDGLDAVQEIVVVEDRASFRAALPRPDRRSTVHAGTRRSRGGLHGAR
jgi:hypothetical protein